jgi:sulfur carrier protein
LITVTVNQQPVTLPGGCSVADYLANHGFTGKRIAVELNREIVPRSTHAQQQIADGDQMEIIQAVGGG